VGLALCRPRTVKWLDKHERQLGEEAPIGLILCAQSSREQVELLQMHQDGITVAEYWTVMVMVKNEKPKWQHVLGLGLAGVGVALANAG
jgi:hypothetical protein